MINLTLKEIRKLKPEEIYAKLQEFVMIPKESMLPIPKYDTEEAGQFLDRLFKACLKLFLEKDTIYGGSWQEDGFHSAFLNLKRKTDRLDNLYKKGTFFDSTLSENVADTLVDAVNYGGLLVYFLYCKEEGFKETVDVLLNGKNEKEENS